MLKNLLRLVACLLAALMVCIGISEIRLHELKVECRSLDDAFNSVQHAQKQGDERTWPLDLIPNEKVTGAVSWSAGNKTYSYFRLSIRKRVILDFWGTNSLSREPQIWLEKPRADGPCFILTYQPQTFPSETPWGTVRSGFLLWKYDGQVYRPTGVWVCPVDLWLRNPLPFQD